MPEKPMAIIRKKRPGDQADGADQPDTEFEGQPELTLDGDAEGASYGDEARDSGEAAEGAAPLVPLAEMLLTSER